MLHRTRNVLRFSRLIKRAENYLAPNISIANRLYSNLKDEYWQQSDIPSDHFQRSLPRLPIPSLENTCRRYLEALEPLLSGESFKEASRVVQDFSTKEGPQLQAALLSYNKKHNDTSYIAEAWFDNYWTDRRPLVLNFNPYLIFNNDSRVEYMDQAVRATNIIVSSLRFRRSLLENVLEPDVYYLKPGVANNETFRRIVRRVPPIFSSYMAYWYAAYPLNISNHKYLFSTSRIPRRDRDELMTESSARHVVVVMRGDFYVFDVIMDNGNMVDPKVILENIRYIIDNSKESLSSPASPTSSSSPSSSPPSSPFPQMEDSYPKVGYFTSMERNSWADVRQKLQLLGNRDNLDFIEKSIILISLELEDEDMFSEESLAKMFLAGDGANRWFDKSVTLIVGRRGVAGFNFEHSWGDGVPILRYFQDVYKDSLQNPFVQPTSVSAPSSSLQSNPSRLVKKMRWKMTSELESELERAKLEYKEFTSTLSMRTLSYGHLNKNFLKQKKLSPDSFMQLAFQIAFNKAYSPSTRQLPTSYESCSTAAFKHGRTETLRPATKEVQQAVNLFRNHAQSPPGSTYLAMKACSDKHVILARQASMGQGFDRHLFGLKTMAHPSSLPALFTHSSYHLINHNLLSSSTLSSPAILAGGFAPTAKDALGIGYFVDSTVSCILCGYSSHRNLQDYKEALLETFKQLNEVLNAVDI